MEKIIALNHKMNLEYDEIKEYIKEIKKIQLNPIIFPTSIYAKELINNNIITGLQNVYHQNKGPYTGEISPRQAKSIGIEYVLVGHYERRELFKETNKEINEKIKSAIENKLKVILCIGEKKEEDYKEVLKKQITESLKDINDKVIIAYEPVWAIGSNEIPSQEEIKKIIKYIKSLFNYDVKVLYGGSVNSQTIKKLKEVNEVSGYLIGSNSTSISELKQIKEVVN